jgi:Na+:H+ antiporter, NhaA family
MASGLPQVAQAPGRGKYLEALWIERILHRETVGGMIILAAAVLAVILANSPLGDEYFALRDTYITVGIADFVLKISVGHFAADGLLAIFFFLVGLELKREFVAGELNDPKKALVPVVAAIGGVIVPAIIYLQITQSVDGAARGWAIPIATDIAFALAVLALVGTSLPIALRMFLLTLAVVDDLIGITIIAVFYTDEVVVLNLALSLVFIALYGFLAQRFTSFFHLRLGAAWVILLPIGIVAWFFMYGSGVHATIAGVLLALTVPVRAAKRDVEDPIGEPGQGLAGIFEHRFRPMSAGFAVPLFAFFSAGVAAGAGGEFVDMLLSPISLGIILALVVGKTVGVLVATWLVTRLPGLALPRGMAWPDLVGVALLAGIGFTVSLLIGELSFGLGTVFGDEAKIGILVGSVLAAGLAAILLTSRNRYYKEQVAKDSEDLDQDGIPDVYQDSGETKV